MTESVIIDVANEEVVPSVHSDAKEESAADLDHDIESETKAVWFSHTFYFQP